jgi:hypothetical protein
MNDREMRLLLIDAFAARIGRQGSILELQDAQAVTFLETGYGSWKPPGDGSFNFGAQQATASWTGATFEYTDTNPNPDGTDTPYVAKFRKYPTAAAGAEDFIRVLYQNNGRDLTVLPSVSQGTLAFSTALFQSHYYAGRGATVAQRIAHHHDAVVAAIRRQCAALGEDLPPDIAALPHVRPVLKLGTLDRVDTKELQDLLNRAGTTPPLVIDGGFGRKTDLALRAFQAKNGLADDGICGPKTWAALGAT